MAVGVRMPVRQICAHCGEGLGFLGCDRTSERLDGVRGMPA